MHVPLPLESVPNFSEAREQATLEALTTALGRHAEILDLHSDTDHNRSVFTLVGDEHQLVQALLAGIACARDRIDYTRILTDQPLDASLRSYLLRHGGAER